MEKKLIDIDGVRVAPSALERITECAKNAHVPPGQWVSDIAAEVARRSCRLKQWRDKNVKD